ncbi:MAG: hypothetical protein H0V44_16665 [Planctomycetes bacterium]|nr:hypothetical protein [Planctomycetota bacterium]
MSLPAIAFASLVVLIILLHLLQRRAIRELSRSLERQARIIETLAARAVPPASGTSGRIARAPQSGTAALERRRDPQQPAIVERKTPAPMAAMQERHTPTGSARLVDDVKRPPTTRHARPGEWNPTHRITFAPDNGKPQTWLVAIVPAPYGYRVAVTHAEWAADVTPAWHCGEDGAWRCHGQRTPDGARGKVSIDEFTGSHPV